MPELRWILLGLGVLFCLGLWWWETRRRSQASGSLHELDSDESLFSSSSPAARLRAEGFEEIASPRHRIEPTFGDPTAAELPDETAPDFVPEPATSLADDKIISMRLFCPPDAPFEGRALSDALQAEGLEHGEFSIFHKYGEDGERLFSVASLLEPGSFDLNQAEGAVFKGVVFFAVQKQAGETGLAEMRRTAQAVAGRLNGNLSAER